MFRVWKDILVEEVSVKVMVGAVQFILMALMGLLSGVVMSLVGASAVMIIVPVLNLVFSFEMHEAIAISLLVDTIASLAVGYVYWRRGNVNLRQGLWIAVGSIVGAQLGAGFTVVISGWFLALSFGLWMVGSGIIIWRKGLDRTAIVERFNRYITFSSPIRRTAVALALGFGIGVNSGIFGAGGGILIMMVLIFVLDYPVHRAVGTSTVIMAVTAASAAVGYSMRISVDVFASLLIAVGTITGGTAGARLANLASERTLSRIIGGLFISLGVALTVLKLF